MSRGGGKCAGGGYNVAQRHCCSSSSSSSSPQQLLPPTGRPCIHIAQVAAGCSERGRVIDKLRERFGLLFSSICSMCQNLEGAQWEAAGKLGQAEQRLKAESARAVAAEQALQEKDRRLQGTLECLDSLQVR